MKSYDDYNSTAESAANYFGTDPSQKQIRVNRGFAKNPSGGYDVATLKKNIYEQNVTVQYELQTPYTERVIIDQPIHTLDDNGEQFVRYQYEHGLYFSDNNTSPASIFGGDWTSLGSFSSGGNTIYVWKKS